MQDVVVGARKLLAEVSQLDPSFVSTHLPHGDDENEDESERDTGSRAVSDMTRFVERIVSEFKPFPEERMDVMIRKACQLSARFVKIQDDNAIDPSTPLPRVPTEDGRKRTRSGDRGRRVRRRFTDEDDESDDEDEDDSDGHDDGGSENEGDDDRVMNLTVGEMRTLLLRILEFCYYAQKMLTTLRASHHVLRSLHRVDTLWGKRYTEGSGPTPTNILARGSTNNFSLAAGIARFANIDAGRGGGGGGSSDEATEEGGGGEAKKSDLNNVQQLIIYILNVLQDRGYRRYGTDCYKSIISPCGRFTTRAWDRACSIKDVVYVSTRKELNFDQWKNATKTKHNIQAVEDYLTGSVDVQFPALVKDRYMFAFRNGLYVTHRAKVLGDVYEGTLADAFIPYGEHDAIVPDDLAACKYFDLDFPIDNVLPRGVRVNVSRSGIDNMEESADASWRAIPTPYMQSVLDYQTFPPEVCDWVYALIGRLLYTLNEEDGWQVIPFLKGQAGSGKSTLLLNVCRNFFHLNDVGVLSNNIERKFGLGAISEKFVFIAPEIKSDLQLEQAEFQSMVSGESVQLALKHQTARAVEWSVPGIMAGNETPRWKDNSGSIGRRVIIFEFIKKVMDSDTSLGKKLQHEMPYIILKCNRAYQSMVRKVGYQNIWSHLPEYFHQQKEELAKQLDPLKEFIDNTDIFDRKTDPQDNSDLYMPFNELTRMFNAYCDENNYKRRRINVSKVKQYLSDICLQFEDHATVRPYPHQEKEGGPDEMTLDRWIVGMQPRKRARTHFNGGGNVFNT